MSNRFRHRFHREDYTIDVRIKNRFGRRMLTIKDEPMNAGLNRLIRNVDEIFGFNMDDNLKNWLFRRHNKKYANDTMPYT
jgi:hypothetical protein